MDSNNRYHTRLFGASKCYQSNLHSRSDLYIGSEEIDDEHIDELKGGEIPCPFCYEEFDLIGLCCHIDDEHPLEAKNGICPTCGIRVGIDIVGHIVTEHGQFKMQRKRRSRKGLSHSNIALLRKELQDGNLQALLGGSSSVSSSNAVPDPLISSFMYSLPIIDEPLIVQDPPSAELESISKSSDENLQERTMQSSPLSDKDQEERAIRCEFVQGMLLSTMFDDIL